LSGLDLPPGTKWDRVITGGDDALRIILDLIKEMDFSGYVSVKLQSDEQDISSFLLVKNSQPTFGIREVISQEVDTDKKVRRIYAGEHTIEDVKQDSCDENASIEIHKDVDVDDIINQYSQETKTQEDSQTEDEEKPDSRRIGLFWGSGGDTESLEIEVLREKLKNWEDRGYNVSKLKEVFSGDTEDVKAAFDGFEEAVTTLEELGAELELFSMAGFDEEVKLLRQKLKDPEQIDAIKAQIEELEEKASKTQTDDAKEREPEKVCIVCGYPISDEKKCPRCGAWAMKKETMKKEGSRLLPGHCYIVAEEKMERSLSLFIEMMDKEYSGFVITRKNPRYLKENIEAKDVKLLWLTDRESSTEATIPPVLERIIYEISNFLKSTEKGCLILDGIEYLVSSNSFDPVLRFIRSLIDEVSETQSVFLITVGPYTLKPQELKILEREMEKISSDENK
jgi:rubrerythrin